MADILDHIFMRRSIRKFTDQKVDDTTIDKLLQAAMAAPSATNSKPWEYVVITDETVLADVQNNIPFGKHGAPLMIIVCGNPAVASNKIVGEKFWVQDCSASTQNILLAASGLGLGACWIGIYPIHTLIQRISALIALPENVTPLCAINIGYPLEQKIPRTQYDASRIHWQGYNRVKNNARLNRPLTRLMIYIGVVTNYVKWLINGLK